MQKTTQNICHNNCEFAVRSFMLSYGGKCGDNCIDAEYMWRCSKIDKLITSDSALHLLGCASYSNIKNNELNAQAESLIKEVDAKLDELAKVVPLTDNTTPSVPRTIIHAAKPIAPELPKESIVDIIADNSEVTTTTVEVEKSAPIAAEPKTRKPKIPSEAKVEASPDNVPDVIPAK